MSHFLAMGGYAQFVWPAYAVAVAVLGGLAWQSLAAHRRTRRELEAAQAARAPRERG